MSTTTPIDERLKSKAWASRELGLPGKELEAEWKRRDWPIYRHRKFVRFELKHVLRFKEDMAITDEDRVERLRISLRRAEEEILGGDSEPQAPGQDQHDDGCTEAQ